jgi:hypothetical protein
MKYFNFGMYCLEDGGSRVEVTEGKRQTICKIKYEVLIKKIGFPFPPPPTQKYTDALS